ncbi:MAG TPA: PhzF family phenazine biosynthesis protein [Synergistales bacterium]|jgi:PhzF family phenazine biosynthesis protein|nr:PhzF family phenazine biosynthesis protein [Synergistales bacterium]HRV71916.1 PhzF family phenazine biosynthesis protein [Thermovirgaceae bacterium]
MVRIGIKQVDAFTKDPFGGNPAGVVTVADSLDEEQMQSIAREMNLSETAFVAPSKRADFKVRFFTPYSEVDLCGHATIGSFHALHEEGRLDPGRSVFSQETKAGVLEVERIFVDGRPVFMMTQAKPLFEKTDASREEIAGILRVDAGELADTLPLKVSTGIWWFVAGLKRLDTVMNLKPDFAAMSSFSERHGLVGMIPFSLQALDPSFTFHMRAFAPLVGVNEDPVCGTGNGCAGAYIGQNRLVEFEKSADLSGEAGYEVQRPGQVLISLLREGESISQVKVGGSAVTILEGEMVFQGPCRSSNRC